MESTGAPLVTAEEFKRAVLQKWPDCELTPGGPRDHPYDLTASLNPPGETGFLVEHFADNTAIVTDGTFEQMYVVAEWATQFLDEGQELILIRAEAYPEGAYARKGMTAAEIRAGWGTRPLPT